MTMAPIPSGVKVSKEEFFRHLDIPKHSIEYVDENVREGPSPVHAEAKGRRLTQRPKLFLLTAR